MLALHARPDGEGVHLDSKPGLSAMSAPAGKADENMQAQSYGLKDPNAQQYIDAGGLGLKSSGKENLSGMTTSTVAAPPPLLEVQAQQSQEHVV